MYIARTQFLGAEEEIIKLANTISRLMTSKTREVMKRKKVLADHVVPYFTSHRKLM